MSDAYARCLFPKGQGYPLFVPQPFDDLPEEARKTGTQIGDVGIITLDGSFDPIFNILRAADDPANRFGLPAAFEPAVLPTDDILIWEQYHAPRSVIWNASKKRRPNSQEIQVVESSTQTALLILPDGALRMDSRSLRVFRDYALKNAQSWYAFVNGDLQRILGNGELYLITGVTKSTSWCVATFDGSSVAEKGSLNMQATLLNGEVAWAWDTSNTGTRSGPYRRAGEESWRDNQTVFLRGLKVAVRSGSWDDFSEEEDYSPNVSGEERM
ncbi:hypothetical protein C8R43DRAFT_888882 [Mycena crocata]|nr:hypothetical protein C8R43DRAFT_888882 [Mycena crocata]